MKEKVNKAGLEAIALYMRICSWNLDEAFVIILNSFADPEDLYDFLFMLNGLSVPTRYPDDLKKLLKDYNKNKTRLVIDKGKEVLKWLKTRL